MPCCYLIGLDGPILCGCLVFFGLEFICFNLSTFVELSVDSVTKPDLSGFLVTCMGFPLIDLDAFLVLFPPLDTVFNFNITQTHNN